MATADENGDGKPDLVVVNAGFGLTSVGKKSAGGRPHCAVGVLRIPRTKLGRLGMGQSVSARGAGQLLAISAANRVTERKREGAKSNKIRYDE